MKLPVEWEVLDNEECKLGEYQCNVNELSDSTVKIDFVLIGDEFHIKANFYELLDEKNVIKKVEILQNDDRTYSLQIIPIPEWCKAI